MPELFFLGAKLNENGSTDWHTQWRLLDTTGPCIICAYHHFTKLDVFHRVPNHPWILQILDGRPLRPRFWWGHASEKGWRFRFSWHPHSTGGRSVVRKETNTFRSWNVPRRKQSSVQIRERALQKLPPASSTWADLNIEKDAVWQGSGWSAVHTEEKQGVRVGLRLQMSLASSRKGKSSGGWSIEPQRKSGRKSEKEVATRSRWWQWDAWVEVSVTDTLLCREAASVTTKSCDHAEQ